MQSPNRFTLLEDIKLALNSTFSWCLYTHFGGRGSVAVSMSTGQSPEELLVTGEGQVTEQSFQVVNKRPFNQLGGKLCV